MTPYNTISYFSFDNIDETTFFKVLKEITTLIVNTHFNTAFDKETIYNNIDFIDNDFTNLKTANISLKHLL